MRSAMKRRQRERRIQRELEAAKREARESIDNGSYMEYEDGAEDEEEEEEELDYQEPYVGMTISFTPPPQQQDNDQQGPEKGGRGGTIQVLPVAESFDESKDGPPQDGLQYLYLVRQEAATFPEVTRVDLGTSVKVKKSPVIGSKQQQQDNLRNITFPKRPSALPSPEWRAVFVDRFNNVRKTLSEACESSNELKSKTVSVPKAENELGWHNFIFGRNLQTLNGEDDVSMEDNESQNMEESEEGNDEGYEQNNDQNEVGNEYEDSDKDEDEDEDEDGDSDHQLQDENVTYHDYSSDEDDGTTTDPAQIVSQYQAAIRRKVEHQASLRPKATNYKSKRSLVVAMDNFQGRTFYPKGAILPKLGQPTALPLNKVQMNYQRPHLTVMNSISLDTKFDLLQYMNNWIQQSIELYKSLSCANPFDTLTSLEILTQHEFGWIMSILSSLNELLIGSHISILRSLAKTCQEIISILSEIVINNSQQLSIAQQNQIQEQEGSCWMIIVVVASVWKQHDFLES